MTSTLAQAAGNLKTVTLKTVKHKTASFDSPVGRLFATWTPHGLYSFNFGNTVSSSDDLETRISIDRGDSLAAKLRTALNDYFTTGVFACADLQLDWQGVSDFHRQVLELCARIPAASTVSYGQLARQADRPKAARAVGAAMARNRWPIIVPCHRVVAADGKLTGYSGLGGLDTKRKLLAMEAERA